MSCCQHRNAGFLNTTNRGIHHTADDSSFSRWTASLRPLRAMAIGPIARFVVAGVISAVAILARLALDPLWGTKLPYITLFPAIMASAWLGGLWPGLLTTVIT